MIGAEPEELWVNFFFDMNSMPFKYENRLIICPRCLELQASESTLVANTPINSQIFSYITSGE